MGCGLGLLFFGGFFVDGFACVFRVAWLDRCSFGWGLKVLCYFDKLV